MPIIDEWTWIQLVVWVLVTVFGNIKRDPIIKTLGAFAGIIFGLLNLSNLSIIGIIIIFLNLYLLYEAVID